MNLLMVMANLARNILKSFVKSGLILEPNHYCLYLLLVYLLSSSEVMLMFATVILCRVYLNKQIQLLAEHMASLTQDVERQQSHSMASTTAIYGHQPPMIPQNTLVMENDRVESQVYIRNGPGDNNLFCSPAPYSYTDNLSVPPNSISRDYAPKIIDVNYTEGSNDKRWSSKNFPWTKDLEVIFFPFKSICLLCNLVLVY